MEKNNLLVPIAIVIAGALIAGSLFLTNKGDSGSQAGTTPGDKVPYASVEVRDNDHIVGNPDAPVIVVEYSDTECPFCKQFHSTMQQVMDTYGKDGKVAWVYRHFPIAQLHSKAPHEAEATECAAELGGNDGFWAFLNRLMELTPSNNGFDDSKLPDIAEYVGLNKGQFISCLDSGKMSQRVQDDYQLAVSHGAKGTPYSVVVVRGGDNLVIPGALPYDNPLQPNVKGIIEQALKAAK